MERSYGVPEMTEEQKELVLNNYNLIHYVLKKYKDKISESDYEDYEQISAYALCLAASRYSSKKGTSFSTYACSYIDGYIKRYRKDNLFPFKVPRNIFYSDKIKEISVSSLNDKTSNQNESFGEPLIYENLLYDEDLFEEKINLFIDVEEILLSYPEKAREYFWLYVDGYSQREIAKIYKVSTESVSKYIRKIKADVIKLYK